MFIQRIFYLEQAIKASRANLNADKRSQRSHFSKRSIRFKKKEADSYKETKPCMKTPKGRVGHGAPLYKGDWQRVSLSFDSCGLK